MTTGLLADFPGGLDSAALWMLEKLRQGKSREDKNKEIWSSWFISSLKGYLFLSNFNAIYLFQVSCRGDLFLTRLILMIS